MSTSVPAPEFTPQHRGADPYPRPPLVRGPHDFRTVTDKIAAIVEQKPPAWWWPAFLVASMTLLGGVFAATYLITTGVGVWGSNIPVGWAFDITNFVFWIGIGHAGTLISAILFLFRQKWRTSINRFSEAMTLFAVICAGVYPGIHVGRFWYVWFMFPLPNANHIWPQFRSALLWDLFAVGTYFTVSLIFWYVGLIPDLATLRDRARSRARQVLFGILSFGWRGSTLGWRHYEVAYLMLAGLATPLVLSVHSVVSMDFATTILPGWHTTIFPPYFVAGAIFGGFAMVLTCMIPARAMFKLEDFVTTSHLDVMAKFVLATGTMVGYSYAMEFFTAWYSGSVLEQQIFLDRAFGEYGWAYWTMLTCNLFIPQLLWVRWFRVTPWALFLVAVAVNVGMWFERFVIIVQSLARDNLPSSWGQFYPTWVDWLQMAGDFGLFFTFTLLFIRFLPMLSMAELKGILPGAQPARDTVPVSRGAGGDGSSSPLPPAPRETAETGGTPHAAIARFPGPAELLAAAKAVRAEGYTQIDAYTPYPVHGMVKAIGRKRSRLSLWTLAGGLTGLAAALALQYYLSLWYYPIIVGGKMFRSWEAFVPICFEMTVLFAAFGTLIGLFVLSGLPRYYSPKDRHPGFDAGTTDGFFLTVAADDPKFDAGQTRALLERLGGREVAVVEEE